MTDYSGVTWRVNYGEIAERDQFRVGRLNMESFDGYFELGSLADLISVLNTVVGLGLNQLARGASLQARKVSDGLFTTIRIEPRLDTGDPVRIMSLRLEELTDFLYALGLFQSAVDPEPDDWDISKLLPVAILDRDGHIQEKNIPERLSPQDLDDAYVNAGELVFNVKDYGATGGGSFGTDDTVAVQAALDAAYAMTGIDLGSGRGPIRGARVFVPPGAFRTTAPLKLRPYVSIVGAGTQTSRLFNDTTDLFSLTDADLLAYEAHMSDLWLSTGVTGGHVFNFSGLSTGGIARTNFTRVKMTTSNPVSSIWKQRDRSQLITVKWAECVFDTVSRTVPAFDISVGGNDANSLSWTDSWCHSHGATGAPFFRVESTGAWNYSLTFKNLTGEQNGGGFIHLYAVDGAVIENCPDWDLTAAYADDVFKIASVSGRQSKNVRVENSYRIANPGGLSAGKYDINAASATQQNVRVVGCTPPGLALAAAFNGDVSVDGRTIGFKTVTGTYSLIATDPDEIVCNSASPFNLTLPTGLNSLYGRQFRIKNIGAGVVTLVGTVDGAVNPTIAQWGKMDVRTDGQAALFGRIWWTV